MSLRGQVLAGLRWTASARLVGQLATWAITIVVMRLLTPADYGLLALATVFVGLLGLVSEIGLSSGIVQARDISTGQLRSVFGAVLVMNLVLSCLIAFVLAPAAAWFFAAPRLEAVMQLLAVQFIPGAFTILPEALLERSMQYRGRSLVDLVGVLAGSLLTLVLAYHGAGVWALAWGTIAQATCRAAGMNLIHPFPHLPAWSMAGSGRLFAFGRDVVLTRALWFFYSQADAFIAGKVLGTTMLGLYSVSMHLASMPVQKVAAIVNQLAFAAFSRAQRDAGGVDRHVVKSVRMVSFFAFPALWGMSSVAPEIIGVLLGPSWQSAIPAFTLLCLVMPLRIVSPILHAGLQGIGRADISMRNTLFAAVVMPSAFYVGSMWGLVGLSLAWVLVFPVVFLVTLRVSAAALQIPLRELLGALAPSAGVGVLMYAAVSAVRPLLSGRFAVDLPLLVCTGVVAYGGLSVLLNRPGVLEWWSLLSGRAARS